MPELPEVETIARDLDSALKGQKVVMARFNNTAIREGCNLHSPDMLVDKKLDGITRRGKNLIFNFSDDLKMVCHLKMTGRLIVNADDSENKKHLHFEMKFDKSDLSFFDVRKFGRICITSTEKIKEHPRLSKLGPEPFDITPEEFARRIKGRNRAIKTVLLDQQVIAGLGNIYVDESLFDAGIRPTVKPGRISKARLYKLHESIIKVLTIAINNRGTSVDDYLDGHGQKGNFQNLIKVYGKTDQPCVNCGTIYKRVVLGGRSTHYCVKCQK